MSPAHLKELGRRLRQHEAGTFMVNQIVAGFDEPVQEDLPVESSE